MGIPLTRRLAGRSDGLPDGLPRQSALACSANRFRKVPLSLCTVESGESHGRQGRHRIGIARQGLVLLERVYRAT